MFVNAPELGIIPMLGRNSAADSVDEDLVRLRGIRYPAESFHDAYVCADNTAEVPRTHNRYTRL